MSMISVYNAASKTFGFFTCNCTCVEFITLEGRNVCIFEYNIIDDQCELRCKTTLQMKQTYIIMNHVEYTYLTVT